MARRKQAERAAAEAMKARRAYYQHIRTNRQRRQMLYAFGPILAVIIGLVGYAYYTFEYARPRQPVARVSGQAITASVFSQRLQYSRRQVLNNVRQLVGMIQTDDKSFITQYANGQRSGVVQSTLDALIDEVLIQKEAEARALQSLLLAGTAMAKTYYDLAKNDLALLRLEADYRKQLEKNPDPASTAHQQYQKLLASLAEKRGELAGRLALAGAAYLEVLLQASDDSDPAARAAQLEQVQGRIGRLGELAAATDAAAQAQLLDLAACVAAQADHLAAGRSDDASVYLAELATLAGAPGGQTTSGCRL